jgi:hypothetical protein
MRYEKNDFCFGDNVDVWGGGGRGTRGGATRCNFTTHNRHNGVYYTTIQSEMG